MTLFIVFVGCSEATKPKIEEEQVDSFKHLLLPADVFAQVIDDIEDDVNRFEELDKYDTSILLSDEFSLSVKPLLENGKKIHSSLIQDMIVTGEYDALTADEKEALSNFSDAQLLELSLALNTLNVSSQNIRTDDFWTCMGRAFFWSDFKDLMHGGTKALMSMRSAKLILKTVAKRAVGVIGLVATVVEVTVCLHEKAQ